MKFYTLSEINDRIITDPEGLVTECEDMLHRHLCACAEDIRRHMDQRPILLIAATAGAGRMNILRRMGSLMKGMGVRMRVLSLQDYYTSVAGASALQDPYTISEYDSLSCVNGELLRDHIHAMAACQPVILPRFRYSAEDGNNQAGEPFVREPNELVVIHGTHVLNPELVGDCMDLTARMYLSLRTRIVDNDSHLHPSLIRFARQWIRDRRTRGRDIAELCDVFPVIRDSENRYIVAYKHMAQYELDTTLLYELSVYRHIMLDAVSEMAERPEALPEIRVLRDFLLKLHPIGQTLVPPQSLICDQIGGCGNE